MTQIASLTEQALAHQKIIAKEWGDDGVYYRSQLQRPSRWITSTKIKGEFVDVSVRRIDAQRLVDRAESERTWKGKRGEGLTPEQNRDRAARRARSRVHSLVLRLKCDRMATFGTRYIITLGEFCKRWKKFVHYYSYHTGQRLQYVAVPEVHKDGVHWHMHVALNQFFHIRLALKIWHKLCAHDGPEDVNGSINIRKFSVRYEFDNPTACIAHYIAKYLAKNADVTDLNKKRFWSTRLPKEEIIRTFLEADSIDEACKEVETRYGLDWANVVLTHKGCFFAFPDDAGFWFRITPSTRRKEIPF